MSGNRIFDTMSQKEPSLLTPGKAAAVLWEKPCRRWLGSREFDLICSHALWYNAREKIADAAKISDKSNPAGELLAGYSLMGLLLF